MVHVNFKQDKIPDQTKKEVVTINTLEPRYKQGFGHGLA